MSNKLTQKKNGQPTNAATRNMADQPDYETLVHNIVDFTTTAMLVEQEIEKYRVSDDKYDVRLSLPEITTGSKWASMKSVSHFNLGTALELMLKYLLLRNGRNYPRGREGHKLTVLYDELHRLPSVTRQLETTYQEITGGSPPELVALNRQPATKQPRLENRPISSLKEIFVYCDEDMKLYLKRYTWPAEVQKNWRHYLIDIKGFTTFMKHVMENIEQYIAPADGAKQGGTGTGEQGTRASKGEGTGQRKTD